VKRSRAATVLTLAVWVVVLAGGLPPSIVLANGIGDLYAGVPSGVLELHVASSKVVEEVEFGPAATSLAFSNDGRTLWLARGQKSLTRIDIETISLGASLALPGPASAAAVPQGSAIVVAVGSSRLAIVDPATGRVRASEALPAEPNLLAADRREPLAVAASRAAAWVAILDPSDGSVHTVSLKGTVAAIAVDRAGATAYAVTAAPNRLWRIQLATAKVTEQVELSASPTAVTSTTHGPVIASGRQLWLAASGGVRRLGTTEADILAIAASDDGRLIYVGHGGGVTTLNTDGVVLRTLALAAGRTPNTLAAIPAPPSLGSGAGPGTSGPSGPSGSAGSPASFGPVPPATSTNPVQALVEQPVRGVAFILVAIAAVLLASARVRRVPRRRP
jgi:sugar lactone lactonase YvrE